MQDLACFNAFSEILVKLDNFDVIEIRPKEKTLEKAFFGDYDFLYNPKIFQDIFELFFTVCKSHKISFRLSQRAFKKRITMYDFDKEIVFEFWPHIELKHKNKFTYIQWNSLSGYILDTSKQKHLIEIFSAIYITHLYFKNKKIESDEVRYRLNFYISQLADNSDSQDLIRYLRNILDTNFVSHNANALAIKFLVNKKIIPESIFLANIHINLKRINQKLGMRNVIPIIGPDGSGKTTLIKHLDYSNLRFKNLFRTSLTYKMIIKLNKPSLNSKNLIDEKILIYIQMISLIKINLLRISRGFFKKRYLMDRYFYDYLSLGIRNNDIPLKIIPGYKIIAKFIPRPRKLILLSCSNDILRLRKDELTKDSIDSLYKIYTRIIVNQKISDVIIISCENSITENARLAKSFLN